MWWFWWWFNLPSEAPTKRLPAAAALLRWLSERHGGWGLSRVLGGGEAPFWWCFLRLVWRIWSWHRRMAASASPLKLVVAWESFDGSWENKDCMSDSSRLHSNFGSFQIQQRLTSQYFHYKLYIYIYFLYFNEIPIWFMGGKLQFEGMQLVGSPGRSLVGFSSSCWTRPGGTGLVERMVEASSGVSHGTQQNPIRSNEIFDDICMFEHISTIVGNFHPINKCGVDNSWYDLSRWSVVFIMCPRSMATLYFGGVTSENGSRLCMFCAVAIDLDASGPWAVASFFPNISWRCGL